MQENSFYPSVLQVVPTDNYEIYAYMNDGSIRRFDVAPLIEEGTVFAPLSDIATFKTTATVMNGTAAWDLSGKRDDRNCIDIDPFTIYESEAVPDPLEKDGHQS